MDNNYLKDVLKNLIDCSRGRLSKQDCIIKLTLFKDDIRSKLTNQVLKDQFINNHYDILSSIKFELEYLIKEPHMQPNNDIIRLRDRLYADLLRIVHIQNEMRKVTTIFNEFLKGITYFNNQIPNSGQPIYHRPAISCPSRGNINEECINTNTAPMKSKNIRLCYIERLIYDELWSKMIFSPQDIRHIEWLNDTCYKDQDIFVEVEMNEENTMPISLKIFDDNIIEHYEKILNPMNNTYDNIVYCYQYNENNPPKYKENTFDSDGTWQ